MWHRDARACISFFSFDYNSICQRECNPPFLGLLNFRVRLDYTPFVRALPVAASSDGGYSGCFAISSTCRISRRTDRYQTCQSCIRHLLRSGTTLRAIRGAIRNNTLRLEHVTGELPLSILIVLATRFSRQFNTGEANRPPKRLCFIIEAFREPEQIGSPKF